MKRLERPLGRALLAVVCLAASMTTVVATASAANDGIPRPPGAIDNRGYELVSQADKNGDQAGYVSPMASDPTTGDRILYDVIGGVPGSTVGTRSELLATRTATGWVSRNALPSFSELPGPYNIISAIAPDLSSWVVASFEGGLGKSTTTPDSALVRLDDQAQPTLLQQFQTFFGGNGPEAAASDDTSHVLAIVPEQLDPTHQPNTANVYDVGSGTPVLVSVMPGTTAAPLCGVPFATSGVLGFANDTTSATQHWVSTDGSRAFFQTQGDNCSDPLELYTRDLVARTTTLISGPPLGGDADNGVDRLIQATPDGRHAFFRTATSLDPADDADGNSNDMDVYEWSADTNQSICITCAVPNANVRTTTGTNLDVVVAEDGSRVYFTSASALTPDSSPAANGTPNLYVVRDGVVHFIARTNGINDRPARGGEATPDGSVLIFRSNRPELNAITGTSNGGLFQYYRYDDRDQSVTCISCPPGGAATVPVLLNMIQTSAESIPARDRVLSDDGSTIFFLTWDALVPEDVNQGPDIYEWHDGQVGLITNGATIYPSSRTYPALAGTTSSGGDVFFEDAASLAPEVRDGAQKLYDARVNGGFPPPPTPPAPCQGESCQGQPSSAPSLAGIGSLTFTGSGNLTSTAVSASFHAARVTAAQRARLARTGVLTLSVRVTAAGRVSALMQTTLGRRVSVVARSARTAHGSGTVRLTLRLSHAARAQLARTGRLRVVLAVSYSRVRTAQRQSLLLHATSHGR
ncbi:MAG TPA: hypothetical protein VFU94_13430 [Conexibacter sp.]|nr:hypothetical protein [Conexibacter sp.]